MTIETTYKQFATILQSTLKCNVVREYNFAKELPEALLFGQFFKSAKERKAALNRKFAFDFAIVEAKIAIESEGGVWSGGRHTRGKGYINDCEKYNLAVCLGWRVLRFTPDQLLSSKCFETIKTVYQNAK